MTATVGAGKGERSVGRLGYRSGYYERTLVTRVGRIELRVPPMDYRDNRQCRDLHHTKWCIFTPANAVFLRRR